MVPASHPIDSSLVHATARAPRGCEGAVNAPGLRFVGELTRRYRSRLDALLAARRWDQASWDDGQRPGFLEETAELRRADWRAAPLPEELSERRIEVLGPAEPGPLVRGLSSGARAFVADLEDGLSPTWTNVTRAQQNLLEAVTGTITCEQQGVELGISGQPAQLAVRPRGLHLVERHVLVDAQPAPAALFDAGLFLSNAARALGATGAPTLHLSLPKLEHHLEARLWDDVLRHAEDALRLVRGAIKVTALIETLPAAFQIDEIIHALRDRIVGLRVGRWDYLLSRVRALRAHGDALLPDAGQVALTQPPLRALTRLLVDTCHRRGIHAMGAGARDVADRSDAEARHQALARVRQIALREARFGHDGTTVTHAGLVPLARRVFDLNLRPADVVTGGVAAHDLLARSIGTCTATGLRADVTVGLRYLDAWLRGHGRLLLAHRVVDAASAELARARTWQRLHRPGRLDDGTDVTPALVERLVDEELTAAREQHAASGLVDDRLDEARGLLLGAVLDEQLSTSFTAAAYEQL